MHADSRIGGAFDLKNEMKNNALFSGSYPECIAGINQDDVSYSHRYELRYRDREPSQSNMDA
jgi:hypothetical protein